MGELSRRGSRKNCCAAFAAGKVRCCTAQPQPKMMAGGIVAGRRLKVAGWRDPPTALGACNLPPASRKLRERKQDSLIDAVPAPANRPPTSNESSEAGGLRGRQDRHPVASEVRVSPSLHFAEVITRRKLTLKSAVWAAAKFRPPSSLPECVSLSSSSSSSQHEIRARARLSVDHC